MLVYPLVRGTSITEHLALRANGRVHKHVAYAKPADAADEYMLTEVDYQIHQWIL
jgi:hypothetical protein